MVGFDATESIHYVYLPSGGKLVADFSGGASIIISDYRGNRRIERSDQSLGFYKYITVTDSSGIYQRYSRSGQYDPYRLEAEGTPDGLETKYIATGPLPPTMTVKTPGGIVYTFNYTTSGYPAIQSITGSDGKSVTYGYSERAPTFPNNGNINRLTSATDGCVEYAQNSTTTLDPVVQTTDAKW